jgi:uncharacterized protein (DUF2267 family)
MSKVIRIKQLSISELEIKALPQNLPHEIKVSIDGLNTFQDHILVKDLVLPKEVKIIAKPDEIVVSVAEPAKVEEELAKEIVKVWLETPFAGGRHKRRLEKIEALEREKFKR